MPAASLLSSLAQLSEQDELINNRTQATWRSVQAGWKEAPLAFYLIKRHTTYYDPISPAHAFASFISCCPSHSHRSSLT